MASSDSVSVATEQFVSFEENIRSLPDGGLLHANKSSVFKNFSLTVFSQVEYHMVRLAVVYDIMYGCCSKKAAIVPMFNNAGTYYFGGCKVSGDETNKTWSF